MKKALIAAVVSLLVGCSDPTKKNEVINQTNSSNRQTLASAPVVVGMLPNGRSVVKYTIGHVSQSGHVNTHYLYVVDNETTVSSNYTTVSGKMSIDNVNVVVHNGPLTESELLALADKIKSERAEYERLKAKYEGSK